MTARKPSKAKALTLALTREEVMAEIKAPAARKKEIEDQHFLLDPDTVISDSEFTLRFVPFRALDTALITKRFPVDKFDQFYKLALDTATFKKDFSENELVEFQKVTYRIKLEG